MNDQFLVLPDFVVDGIFDRLSLIYGREWLNKWQGMKMPDVKKEWARQLGDIRDYQIAWVLDNLPDRAPTLPAFRRLAMQAPSPAERAPALPEPDDPALQTWEQKARIHALCAAAFESLGARKAAERSATRAAQAAEMARDEARARGDAEPLLAGIVADAQAAVAQARERRIRETLADLPAARDDGRGWQFDLEALLRRHGTAQEKPRDWARIIAARHERGDSIGYLAVQKARDALKTEARDWLDSPYIRLETSAAAAAASDAWAEGAWL